jgi:Family of unknown function (DUF6559)
MGFLTKMAESRAVKKIAKRMPAVLVSSYGYAETYTSGQVGTALENSGCNSDYIDHAYAMFCDESTFSQVSNGDYSSLHQDVADTCFGGNSSFSFSDATSFSGDFSSGGDCGGGGSD